MKSAARTRIWPVFIGATAVLSLAVLSTATHASDAYTFGLTDKLRQHATTPLKDSGAGAIEEDRSFGADPSLKRRNVIVDLKRELTRHGKMLDHVAAETQMLSVLTHALATAGLAEIVDGQGPVTIFAPSDEAFAKLAEADRADLFKPANAPKLRKVVAQHIVRGKVSWADFAGRTVRLKTLAGTELVINGTEGVQVGSARLKISDVLAANGIIHIIDSVLITDGDITAMM